MRRLLPALLCLLALLAGPLSASPPKPKAARFPVIRVQGVAACPAVTGDCRLILTWTRPANYMAATDAAGTVWAQTSPTAATLFTKAPAGTADTVMIPRPAAGASKSGKVTLCYSRTGWTGKACNAPLTWTVTAPQVAPDTATGLQLSAIIVSPASVPLTAGGSVQLCPVARWSDGSVTAVVPWSPTCDPALAAARAGG